MEGDLGPSKGSALRLYYEVEKHQITFMLSFLPITA